MCIKKNKKIVNLANACFTYSNHFNMSPVCSNHFVATQSVCSILFQTFFPKLETRVVV